MLSAVQKIFLRQKIVCARHITFPNIHKVQTIRFFDLSNHIMLHYMKFQLYNAKYTEYLTLYNWNTTNIISKTEKTDKTYLS